MRQNPPQIEANEIPEFESLSGTHFDVAVIGGGINGAGTARLLSQVGYSVVLAERQDYGSGATSASARMQHVGLRYLAPGGSLFDFILHPDRLLNALRMARMTKSCWTRMAEDEPDLLKKISLCFPIYDNSPYKGWHLDLAFSILERLPPRRRPTNYRRLRGKQIGSVPILTLLQDRDRLLSAAVFDDFQIDWPERLCMNEIRLARENGATIFNYTTARILERSSNGWALGLVSTRSGAEVAITAGLVINTAGAWIDEVNRPVRGKELPDLVQPAKGTIIVGQLPPDCSDQGLFCYSSKNQPFIAMPSRGMHFFGPTETPFDGAPEGARPHEDEIQYLVGEVNSVFPGISFKRNDVRFAWSGVRPHTRDPRHPEGYRSLVIHDLEQFGKPGLIAVTGGSINGYRETIEQVHQLVADKAGPQRASRSHGAADDGPGPDASHNMDGLSDNQGLALQEQVVHLDDLLFRRTGLAWANGMCLDEAATVALEIASVLGWDEARVDEETHRYRSLLCEKHAMAETTNN